MKSAIFAITSPYHENRILRNLWHMQRCFWQIGIPVVRLKNTLIGSLTNGTLGKMKAVNFLPCMKRVKFVKIFVLIKIIILRVLTMCDACCSL